MRRIPLWVDVASQPERTATQVVTPGYFSILGMKPACGREFSAAEGAPGGEAVVMLSDGLRRRFFGPDIEVLGKTLDINGQLRGQLRDWKCSEMWDWKLRKSDASTRTVLGCGYDPQFVEEVIRMKTAAAINEQWPFKAFVTSPPNRRATGDSTERFRVLAFFVVLRIGACNCYRQLSYNG